MNNYKILIEGRNLLMTLEHNGLKKYGFITTRYIQSTSKLEAEIKATNLVKSELKTYIRNKKNDIPRFYIEEVQQVASFEGISVPGEGFTWYEEE